MQEGCGRGAFLVAQELGVCQTSPVVDRDVKEFPAFVSEKTSVGSIPGHTMPWAIKPSQFLRVDVHELAGPRAFVSVVGDCRLKSAEFPKSSGRDDTLGT